MAEQRYRREVEIGRSAADVFAWHERPGALERLTPPWEHVEVLEQRGGIRDGGRVVVRTKIGPVWTRWQAEHRGYVAGREFRDVQVQGPFARWEHVHRFESVGPDRCRVIDEVSYALPGGVAGRLFGGGVEDRLERLFRYRHATLKADLELPPVVPGRVLVSGASGLLGSALVPYLQTQGWQVRRLVRRRQRAADEIVWSPERGTVVWPADAEVDAVVHLAGASLAAGRWTPARKQLIVDSRVQGTRTLAAAVQALARPPRVFISASAVGYYGDADDAAVTEASAAGSGFLAKVCQAWEAEVAPLREAGLRTVVLRTGVVLSPQGGALAKLLPLYRAGLGGRLGDGTQWMSWIARDDWLDVCRACLVDEALQGPVNAVAPAPLRNADFSRILGSVLDRPAHLPAPAAALRLALGEMADDALLAGARVEPAALRARGHGFRHPELEPALRHLLGR